MRDILARAQRATLAKFARSDVLLAFDFDGTLAPIVPDPPRAALRPRTRRLLERLSTLYPSVVISGRSRPDVLPRLEGTGIARVVGNHGLEPHRRPRALRALVRRWRDALTGALDPSLGITVEDKGLSIAVHYRHARPKRRSRETVLAAAARLPRARIVGGKDVVNVVPRRGPHKGTALEGERVRAGCTSALYVGDDETDEDAFSLRHPDRFLTIRVGPRIGSKAGYCIRRQADIDILLATLIRLRRRSARGGGGAKLADTGARSRARGQR